MFTALFGAAALSARTAQAQTADVYSINVDENGNGTWVETQVSDNTVVGSGALSADVYVAPNEGILYVLPFVLNAGLDTPQWVGIYDSDGQTQSDLVSFQNFSVNGGGEVGIMSLYSNDTDGDLADVDPAYWSTIVGNWDGVTTNEDVNGIAVYSTVGAPSDAPGVPSDPTVGAIYTINSGVPVPEPTVMGLLAAGSALLLKRRNRRH
ncbi:MAG: PEP-CTERM sorting domain-containing protein [Tepidisphaeraceae bacterium]|jgi:hypothetical protein